MLVMGACGRYDLALLFACLAVACRSAAPAAPRYEVSGVAEPNPKSAVSALVRVTAKDALRVWVEHGDGPEYGTRTPATRVSEDGLVTVPVIGLRPNAT